jgi:hypothetical protein
MNIAYCAEISVAFKIKSKNILRRHFVYIHFWYCICWLKLLFKLFYWLHIHCNLLHYLFFLLLFSFFFFFNSVTFFFSLGGGLSDRQRAICDTYTYIPQYASGGMASINVACASAVVLQTFAVWANYQETQRVGEKFL